jgi:predicted alpha/beta superfamily hydrolase
MWHETPVPTPPAKGAVASDDPTVETPVPTLPPPMGYFRFHRRFASRLLKNERTITVYLPPKYAKDKSRRYPVLYLHDGQNLFDPNAAAFGVDWHAHITADRLVNEGVVAPTILVGIYNTPQRIDEYTPHFNPIREDGGRGEQYCRFVVEEVKPFVDHQYRTLPGREHTGVAGSSLGGLISLAIARWRPDVFSKVGALSPSLWWMEEQLFADWESDAEWPKRTKFWLDMGTEETAKDRENKAGVKRCRRLVELLKQRGLKADKDYRYLEIEGGHHTESAWAARFDQVMTFLFGA